MNNAGFHLTTGLDLIVNGAGKENENHSVTSKIN